MRKMPDIVLVAPEIPHNTGAIGRLCVGLGARLHLVRPLGFRLDEKSIRRCGLDYWGHLDIAIHNNWDAYVSACAPERPFFLSTHATRDLFDVGDDFPGDALVFGSESAGLPAELHGRHAASFLRIPMPGEHARSINLANAVSIAAYEAFRRIRHT